MKKKLFNKKELLSAIDSYEIHDNEVNSIKNILILGDNGLFIKILEEVLDDNSELSFSDFNQYLSDIEYEKIVEQTLETEKRIYEKITRFERFKESSLSNLDVKDLLVSVSGFKANEEELELRKEIFYSLFKNMEYDRKNNPMLYLAKYRIIEKLLEGSNTEKETLEKLVISIRDGVIPIRTEDQIILPSDSDFMTKNNLDEESMKKLKAFMSFFKYEGQQK